MILLQNGRVLDPASGTDAIMDVLVGDDGRVAAIGAAIGAACGAADTVIDASHLIVAPGLVDAHVHFRDPGLTYKEDLATGAASAAAGGYTTVVCMANTKPPVDSVDTLASLMARAKTLPIHVLSVAAVTEGMKGEALTDMAALREAGAVGFSDDGFPIRDTALMLAALKKSRELNMVVSLHEEDPALIGSAGVNQGRVSEAIGVRGAPAAAEEVLVARDCLLALYAGAALHIQHVSSGRTVDILRLMKRLGVRVTSEVTPQHLSLTEDAVLKKGTLAKVNPPLRTEEDRRALIEGLRDGTIDMIATDHAPHADEEKARDMGAAPSGMIGLETALGLCVTHLVRTGQLTMPQLIERMALAPARLYGLDAGSLRVGGPADLVLFDEQEAWTVPDHFFSRSKNSPFIGMALHGKVKYTLSGGKIVYMDRK